MPKSRELEIDAGDLVSILLSLDPSRRLSLLDGCGVPGGKRLIAGFDPFEVIEVRDGYAQVSRRDSDGEGLVESDALSLLDARLASYKTAPREDTYYPASACIATFSYELVHQLERLRSPSKNINGEREPDAVFSFYDALIVHDYETETTRILTTDESGRLDHIESIIRKSSAKSASQVLATSIADSNMTRDEYLAAVDRIKNHISAGDIYQANLTQQFRCVLPAGLDPSLIFERLRRDHPAPYAAFIQRREDTVISISPESFIRVDCENGARQIEARPIKGTRPRGINTDDDARLRSELLASDKDRAENVMIVDLVRNDLGRVCKYGTVEVEDLCTIEEHPTLFHLVSTVRGTLRDDLTAGDILRACFPCGSITGAPKIRAMEIINDVETVPRGLSMGAIGYLAFDGAMDLSVAIRTMTVKDHVARFNVGGGIVADSNPSEEYEESLVKARALFRALGVLNDRN
jgi:para-aminobenzoate synthetase component 1